MPKLHYPNIPSDNLLEAYPRRLLDALFMLEKESKDTLYLVGGTVRDWLVGRIPHDLDFAVHRGAVDATKKLQKLLDGGTLVPLGRQEDEAGRLVWRGLTIDIAAFRKGTATIEEDLCLRDFTLNAMAMKYQDIEKGDRWGALIDPMDGRGDLNRKCLKACVGSFVDDPLRMLRGYRLSASFNFIMEEKTRQDIIGHGEKILHVSVERVSHELDCIMETDVAAAVFKDMAETGLLFHIFPELEKGVGLVQPTSHHLDVFHHNLETLQAMEQVVQMPEHYFPGFGDQFLTYLESEGVVKRLKWAALFHDLGKPFANELGEGGRITFYNHDRIGKDTFEEIARNMRWSIEDLKKVGKLIELHMYPFHLCNVQRKGKISKRACLKLLKKAGDDLKGIMLLSMADSLACRGENAPKGMEKELRELFCTLQETIDHIIQPVLSGPRLMSGTDLIDTFHLQPGPVFSRILKELEVARVEGKVHDRPGAIQWVRQFLQNHADEMQT